MNVILIVLNMLKSNEKLILSSGLDQDLVEKAIELCSNRNILTESQLMDLSAVNEVLETSLDQNDQQNLDDAPEEFIDPLTFILMRNPVKMKTSNVTIDKTTFNQIMLNDQLDPFSRKPLNEDLITEDTELKEKIEAFLKESQ